MTDRVWPVEIGKGEKLLDGTDGSIFAIGSMVNAAREAVLLLEKEGIFLSLFDLRFAKPLDVSLIMEEVGRGKPLITVEENVLCGGVGSAVMELLAAHGASRPILCLGLPDVFIEQGTQNELRAGCRLDALGMAQSVRKWLESVGL